MANERTETEGVAPAQPPEATYAPPAIAWEEPFDSVAASCPDPFDPVCQGGT